MGDKCSSMTLEINTYYSHSRRLIFLYNFPTVDCWDGPDGEPMVQHGYTLTSKITFKSVIETINKYAFLNNQ